jgi:hypothetical protein
MAAAADKLQELRGEEPPTAPAVLHPDRLEESLLVAPRVSDENEKISEGITLAHYYGEPEVQQTCWQDLAHQLTIQPILPVFAGPDIDEPVPHTPVLRIIPLPPPSPTLVIDGNLGRLSAPIELDGAPSFRDFPRIIDVEDHDEVWDPEQEYGFAVALE